MFRYHKKKSVGKIETEGLLPKSFGLVKTLMESKPESNFIFRVNRPIIKSIAILLMKSKPETFANLIVNQTLFITSFIFGVYYMPRRCRKLRFLTRYVKEVPFLSRSMRKGYRYTSGRNFPVQNFFEYPRAFLGMKPSDTCKEPAKFYKTHLHPGMLVSRLRLCVYFKFI